MGKIIASHTKKGVDGKAIKIIALVAVVILIIGSYFLVVKLFEISNGSKDDKVLNVNDLNNPNVDLSTDTSDASVKNLTRELQAKIDKQITDKDNPIDTVKQLSGVLSNTTNNQRKDQLTDFLEDFLTNHSNTLGFNYQGDRPDQAQINYWKGELYAYLVFNFKNMMDNQFMDAGGKLMDTEKEQLKYIDLYLNLANDPKSHIIISEENKKFLSDYNYSKVNEFLSLKNEINAG